MSKTLKGKINYNKLTGKIENKHIRGKAIDKPVLTNLTITPSMDEQTFNHEGFYGYDKVDVAPVDPDLLSDINILFVDYDGSELYNIPLKKLKELPPLPEHNGLIAQGWNWSLEDILAENKPLVIGPHYITNDGKTRIYITLTDENRSPVFYPFVGNSSTDDYVEIDFGDGVVTKLSGQHKHTYEKGGDYIVTLTPVGNANIQIHGSSSSMIWSNLVTTSAGTGQGRVNYGYNNTVKKIELGQSVMLNNSAFAMMRNLETVTIPMDVMISGVTGNNFPSYLCNNCNSLKFITIPSKAINIGGSCLYNTAVKYISLPSRVSLLNATAFSYNHNIKSISIPNSVTQLSNYAISNNRSLQEIYLGDGLSHLGEYVFKDNSALRKITLPKKINKISNYLFQNCHSLTSVIFEGKITEIGKYAFGECRSLVDMEIPNTVTKISENAFSECYSLVVEKLPDNLEQIEQYAFRYVAFGDVLVLPNSLTKIGTGAFQYARINNVVFNDSLLELGSLCFSSSNIKGDVVLPNSITTISSQCFSAAQRITSLTFPDAIENVSINMFDDNNSMGIVRFPSNLKKIQGSTSTNQAYSLRILDFSRCLSIPELSYNLPYNTNDTNWQIHVPAFLYDDWIATTGWSATAIKKRIVGVGKTYGIIRGNDLPYITVFNKTYDIEVSLKGMETLPTIDVVSSLFDWSITELTLTKCVVSLTPKGIEGADTIAVNITYNNETFSETYTSTIYEYVEDPAVTISDVTGASYNFVLDEDGYYENTNQKVGNSYCICKINIKPSIYSSFKINYNQNSENNYDYAIISKPNKTLANSNTAETSTSVVFATTKGVTTTTDKTIIYDTNGLTDFDFYIKYRKDGSGDTGTDTFRFKIIFE